MQARVLKLNADYTPLNTVSWLDGLMLVLDGKADLVANFDQFVRSASREFQIPAVIRLRKYAKTTGKVGCSRENVLARDVYTCQYCGAQPRTKTRKPLLEDLTLDHVVPRFAAVKGKVWLPWINAWKPPSCWENLVTACRKCNAVKGSLPLAKTRLKLRAGYPTAPSRSDQVRLLLNRITIPDEWKEYLPEDSEWRGYWDAELED